MFLLFVNTKKKEILPNYIVEVLQTQSGREVTIHPHNTHPKSLQVNTTQRLPFPFNVPHWSWYGNDYQSSVCHRHQCETKWRNTWKCGPIARHSWTNCRMQCSVGHIPKRGISLNGSFKLQICHPLQYERQKFDDLFKDAPPLQAGDWG